MKNPYDNVPTMGTTAAIGLISNLFARSLAAGRTPSQFKVPFLAGQPGVGKTQVAREVAEILRRETGKTVNLIRVDLQCSTPVDLKGVPLANTQEYTAVWLLPAEFKLDPGADVINILDLDELTDAPPSVLSAAKSLIQKRMVAEHQLPENTCIIAAGNRPQDLAAVSKLPGPLANRFFHLNIVSDWTQWEAWAQSHGIHPAVLAFLNANREKLTGAVTHAAYATPRTWEDVSDVLKILDSGPDEQQVLIGGLVGMGLAAEFAAWYRCCQGLPTVQEIFGGTAHVRGVLTPDQSYFLVMGMAAAAEKAGFAQLNHAIDFLLYSFVREYQVLFFSLLLNRGMRDKLMRIGAYTQWLQRNARYVR